MCCSIAVPEPDLGVGVGDRDLPSFADMIPSGRASAAGGGRATLAGGGGGGGLAVARFPRIPMSGIRALGFPTGIRNVSPFPVGAAPLVLPGDVALSRFALAASINLCTFPCFPTSPGDAVALEEVFIEDPSPAAAAKVRMLASVSEAIAPHP